MRLVLLPLLVGIAIGSARDANAAIITSKTSSLPAPGITLVEGKTRAPSSTFHAAMVSLCAPGLRVGATSNPSSLTTVPSWAASKGATLATNGDFFTTGPRVYGMAVGDGVAWPIGKTGIDPAVSSQYYYDNFGWIAFGPDSVSFTHTGEVKAHPEQYGAHGGGYSPSQIVHTYPAGTVALVSGFPELVTEGRRMTCTSPTATTCFVDRSDMRARNPRTAMGLSEDMQTFILAVVDGRSSTSAGMYGTELAELMEELGAWQAFNIDGGGSSEMWLKGKGTISRPSDGVSRGVANHWGVFTGAGEAGHCMKVARSEETPAKPEEIPFSVDGGIAVPSEDVASQPSSANNETSAELPSTEGGCHVSRGRSDAASVLALIVLGALVLYRTRRESTSTTTTSGH